MALLGTSSLPFPSKRWARQRSSPSWVAQRGPEGLSVGYPGWARRQRREGRRSGLGRVKKDERNC